MLSNFFQIFSKVQGRKALALSITALVSICIITIVSVVRQQSFFEFSQAKGRRRKSAAKTMATVIKSENDKKLYRAIELDNGLRVLIIADLQKKVDSDELEQDTDEDAESLSSDHYGTEDSGNSDHSDMEHSGSEDMEAASDEDNPKDVKDDKKLQSTLSAAALCVSVGSFSDPPELPGLAHFLEHMVFMGSGKYPDENHFENFLKHHGGFTNAFTDCERTVLYFEVRKKYFKEALDIFAQFFIDPLMKKDSVDREIKAVDNEFDEAKHSDSHRKEQLFSSFAKENHPMGKFMWGNLSSLKTESEKQGINLYEYLQKFHAKSYSSHYMTLVVHSRFGLDVQEQWVREIFSEVPKNDITPPDFSQMTKPFDTENFHKLYKVIPVKDIYQLELSWSLPSQMKHYRVKPLHYLGWLVGHEGKGSILSYLKERYWATKLYGGNSEEGFEHNSTHSVFSIGVTLTSTGMEHIQEIVCAIFEYLAMLKKVGVQKRIYDEIKQIEDISFRWIDQEDAVDYVENLCVNMQMYPTEHYITGDHLLMQYNEKLIEECQNALVPSKVNIILTSKNFEEENCDLVEKWFQTQYKMEDIPSSWEEEWETVVPREHIFHIPPPNRLLASDFSLKDDDEFTPMYPVAIVDTDQCKLWFKRDQKFKVPKAYVYFELLSPCINKSPKDRVLMDMYIGMLRHKLKEIAYDADMANLSYKVILASFDSSLYIEVSGFNHRLMELFKIIVDNLCDFEFTDELYEMAIEQLRKYYHNCYIQPEQLAADIRLQLLVDRYWTSVDKQNALNAVTKDMLLRCIETFKEEVYIQGLVQGNMNAAEAKQIADYLITRLQSRPLPKTLLPSLRICQIPVGQWKCRAEGFNRDNNNSVIVNYYQHGPATLKEYCLNDLLIYGMSEPCFDILRTREQLGYKVSSTNRLTEGILSFTIIVCSQVNKFSLQQLDDKIEAFLIEFEQSLEKMTQEEFQKCKNSLIGLKKCKDINLYQEVTKNWDEITNKTYVFDFQLREIEELKKISQEELLLWYKSHILGSGNCKKFSFQVQGHHASQNQAIGDIHSQPAEHISDEETDIISDLQPDNHQSNSSLSPSSKKIKCSVSGPSIYYPVIKFLRCDDENNGCNVTDISQFKDRNKLYPVSKLIYSDYI